MADKRVVVKHSNRPSREYATLMKLHAINGCPEAIVAPLMGNDYLLVTPLGDPLGMAPDLAASEACRLLHDVATALEFASDNGVLHCDVSYGNIVKCGSQGVLIDWHVARSASETVEGLQIGTTLFCSTKTGLPDHKRSVAVCACSCVVPS